MIDAANTQLREAAIKVAAANQKEKAAKNEAARLAVKEKFLNQEIVNIDQRERDLDVIINEKVRELTTTHEMHLSNANSENQILVAMELRAYEALNDTTKALAAIIKSTYKGADLAEICRKMDISVPAGKADIFDSVKKAGKAEDFKSGVVRPTPRNL